MDWNINTSQISYLKRKLIHWSKYNYFDYPWRNGRNRIYSLIAEVLLQRTQADQVVPVYEKLESLYPFIDYSHIPSIEEIEEIIKPLGLPKRAILINQIFREYVLSDGVFPDNKEILRQMKGIGQYTASAYFSLYDNKRNIIVDKNISRLYQRFFGLTLNSELRNDKKLFYIGDSLTPKKHFRDFNFCLIDFSRTICNNSPKHQDCPIRRKCYMVRG